MNYSRWATREEMQKKLVATNLETGVEKTGLPMMYDDKYLYLDTNQAHNLLIGCVGSGKTQAVILPMLKIAMMAGESIVINDPKGEIYSKTAQKLEDEGYKNIVINLDDPRLGNNWNPLDLAYRLYEEDNKDNWISIIFI